MPRRVTLKQVAVEAGVSYQTVSKVINRQATVSEETEARIWSAVHSLGYRPNQIARSLRSQHSRMIAYSWTPAPPEQSNPILDLFLQGMLSTTQKAGYYLLCFPHPSGENQVSPYREMVDTNLIDAFVVSNVEFYDPRIEFLLERRFPFVAFGRSNPGWKFPYVDVDGGCGIRMAVEHLLAGGHRRIAALAWPVSSRVGYNRMEGYLSAMEKAGIDPLPDWVARGEGTAHFGWQATNHWLDLAENRRPTAIVAFNDFMADGAIRAARERDLRVGTDLAVTGFDDAPIAAYLTPPLTTIRQPVWEVGEAIIQMLVELLEGKTPENQEILFQPRLVVRQSSTGLTSNPLEKCAGNIEVRNGS